MNHSLDHIGNLTELIVKLRENADIVENKKIERTEESKTMVNNLLSSIDVAETKLDSAIHHLKIAQETSPVTPGQPTEASPVETPGVTQATEAERVRLSGINGTLIRLEEILQNIIAKAGDSNITNSTSSSGGLLSEIKADVEKQLELVMAASKHEENDGADRKTLDSAKADLDSAIAKLRTIESLGQGEKVEIEQLTDKIDNLQGTLKI